MSLDDRLRLAAQAASQVAFYWLAAAATDDRAEKRRLAARGFHAWSVAARQAGLLEALAPNCAQEGYAEAAKIQDYIEGRAA